RVRAGTGRTSACGSGAPPERTALPPRADNPPAGAKLLAIDQRPLPRHRDRGVRPTVADPRHELHAAAADAGCDPRKYQPSPARTASRAGPYTRPFHTKAAAVERQGP